MKFLDKLIGGCSRKHLYEPPKEGDNITELGFIDMKAKMFSNQDSDGSICAVLGKTTFKDTDITFCSNGEETDAIIPFLRDREFENYDVVFITDLILDSSTAKVIDKLIARGEKLNIVYIDHKPKSEELTAQLNGYSWVILPSEADNATCSSELMYKYLISTYGFEKSEWFDNLVEKSRRYTTYEWEDCGDFDARRLNTFCYLYDRKYLVEKLAKKSIHKDMLFNNDEMAFILNQEQQFESYVEKKNKKELTLHRLPKEDGVGEYNYGVVYAESFISELGNAIAEKRPELDFVIINNGCQKLSFRASKSKDIDLNAIAARVGGGGHVKAAGARVDVYIREGCNEFIMNQLLEKHKNKKGAH